MRSRMLVLCLLCLGCLGCRKGMVDQAKFLPYQESKLFANGSAMRPIPAHTVAQGQLNADEAFFTGKKNGQLVAGVPVPLTEKLLRRGQERFNIYCSVCHAATGEGNGMIVQRGFPPPPSFHSERLRNAPAGHYFDVITHGYGIMFSYASRVEPADRWAIISYIRALQLSRNATLEDVTATERALLEGEKK